MHTDQIPLRESSTGISPTEIASLRSSLHEWRKLSDIGKQSPLASPTGRWIRLDGKFCDVLSLPPLGLRYDCAKAFAGALLDADVILGVDKDTNANFVIYGFTALCSASHELPPRRLSYMAFEIDRNRDSGDLDFLLNATRAAKGSVAQWPRETDSADVLSPRLRRKSHPAPARAARPVRLRM